MALATGILFAVVALLSWGTADFFAKKAIDKVGYKTSLVLNIAIAFLPLLILSAFFFKFHPFTAQLILLTISAGVLGVIGYVFLYRGYQKGNVSVVAPHCCKLAHHNNTY